MPAPPPLPVPAAARQPLHQQPLHQQPLPPLLQRLRQALGRRSSRKAGGQPPLAQDPLQSAGLLLRQARESRGLGLRQLAQDTRISTPVLEALERGWRDRLPEPAYLRTMLPLLEHRLELAPGSLIGALPSAQALNQPGQRRETLLLRFTPGSIDVFTTWQGTLLYGLVTLGLIYALNLQQRHLARQGLLSTTPIVPVEPRRDSSPRQEDNLLTAYPDLAPLQRASRGQALGRLRRESQDPADDLSPGQLSLQLSAPSRVDLHSARDGTTSLGQVSGALSLPVLPPFQLQLAPAPRDAGAVRWKGRPLTAHQDLNGTASFRYPPPRP